MNAAELAVLFGSSEASSDDEHIPKLEDRRTQELVFALVAPVGSGATTVAQEIIRQIKQDYRYETNYIKVSDIINAYIVREGGEAIGPNDPKRIEKLQEAGNLIRNKHSANALSVFSVEQIHASRDGIKKLDKDRRYCTVIDSLKNPEEATLLRQVYGDSFWLIGVFATEQKRVSRLDNISPSLSYIAKIKDADYDEGSGSGQSVRKTMDMADIYFRNDGDNLDRIKKSVERLLALIFGIGVQTPTREEYAMQAASGAALNSACLSRQVGAVVISAAGELLGQGSNDVPKFGGGTYKADDGINDNRCHKWKECRCWNDHYKSKLYNQISDNLSHASDSASVSNALKRSDAKNLIEYSRAVHAEMEAILSVARQGKPGLVGSTLYTTTFPCHGCARHIVASGIHRVVYIEAYPKSLALKLHDDAISTSESETNKVAFLQYEGVSPSSFSRVFGMRTERKLDGKVIDVKSASARPLASPHIDSLVTREEIVLDPVLKKEGSNEEKHTA